MLKSKSVDVLTELLESNSHNPLIIYDKSISTLVFHSVLEIKSFDL